MNWVDVCGSPGIGKSTLCDPLWGPHEIPIEDRLPPRDWEPFLEEITRLLIIIRKHWSIVPAIRMNRRSVRKMATVARTNSIEWAEKRGNVLPYIQTGFVQRGLGFGWRLNEMGIDLNELRPYFRLMPVSIGVAVLYADEETAKQRNNDRKDVPETAHEDRAFMVPLMEKPKEIAIDVIRGRGVPLVEIDTRKPVEESRADLVGFANENAHIAPPHGLGSETPVLQAPVWF
jgi:hypothetical protein